MFYKWNLMAQWSMPRGLEPLFTCGSHSCHCPLLIPGPLDLARPCIHCLAPGQWLGHRGWKRPTFHHHLPPRQEPGHGCRSGQGWAHVQQQHGVGKRAGVPAPSLAVHDTFHVPLIRGLLPPPPHRNQEHLRMEVAISWGFFILPGVGVVDSRGD